jgi:hypothetical protein
MAYRINFLASTCNGLVARRKRLLGRGSGLSPHVGELLLVGHCGGNRCLVSLGARLSHGPVALCEGVLQPTVRGLLDASQLGLQSSVHECA